MGVVYKLKKEVVDFIVCQKKKQPFYSCRNLVVLIRKEFQINLSKSAVNNIIKNANLSSHVGRRYLDINKEGGFRIPDVKKKQLYENVMETAGYFKGNKGEREKCLLGEGVREKAGDKHICEGMGAVFLKAAEWEIFNTFFIGRLLRGKVQKTLPENFDKVCAAGLFLIMAGLRDLGQIKMYENYGLWGLNDLNAQPGGIGAVIAKVNEVGNLSGLFKEYLEQKNIYLQRSGGYKFFLEDGTKLVMDAQMTSFWEGNVPSEFFLQKGAAEEKFNAYLKNNEKSLIFLMIPGIREGSRKFYEGIAAFNNFSGKRVTKAVIFDEKGRETAVFLDIPDKKRAFIVGLWPQQAEFKEWINVNNKDIKNVFYRKDLKQEVYFLEEKRKFTDNQRKGFSGALKVITLWKKKSCGSPENLLGEQAEGMPFLTILTNKIQSSAEEVISEYICRWPNAERFFNILFALRGGKEKLLLEEKKGGEERGCFVPRIFKGIFERSEEIIKIFSDFAEEIDRYSRRYFFAQGPLGKEMGDVVAQSYGLSGFLRRTEKNIYVMLIVPAQYKFYKDLEFAVHQVNNRLIFDNEGRRLFVEIKK